MRKNFRIAGYVIIVLGLVTCCAAALRPDWFGARVKSATPVFQEEKDALTEFRIEREQLRAMQISGLDDIIDDVKSSREMIDAAQAEKIEIMRRAEIEQTITGVLSARGYPECCAAAGDGSLNIMIRSGALTDAETAVIMELVLSETDVLPGDVRIIPIK